MNYYKTKRWARKRELILRRDRYTCVECKRYGKSTIATTVHHIVPVLENNKLFLESWNLISLCNRCHNKMHDRITNELTIKGKEWINRVNPPP